MSTKGAIVWNKCGGLVVTLLLGTFLPAVAKLVHVSISRIEISYTVTVVHLAVRVVVTEDEKLGMVMRLNIGVVEHFLQLSGIGSERRYWLECCCFWLRAGTVLRSGWESWW